MIGVLRNWIDEFLGRGHAAITVPVMDGTLKPNRVLDHAESVLSLEGIDDVASDGRNLWISAANAIGRLESGALVPHQRFDGSVTALAADAGGRLAVAIDGRRVVVLEPNGRECARLETASGRPFVGVNALAFDSAETLLISEGSARRGPDQWCFDLMELGRTGRVLRWNPADPSATVLLDDVAYAHGVLALGDRTIVSESWRHRVRSLASSSSAETLLSELPCYPSRMAHATGGGFWLTAFVGRTQLVEFVLREKEYRQRMIREIDPRHWIAPALSSGKSFLEPLQGAGVKNMGVLKPWAPPRSYGLVMRVADDGRILSSMHSQVDGVHHGCTAVAEHLGRLFVVSKGSGRLLGVDLGAQS